MYIHHDLLSSQDKIITKVTPAKKLKNAHVHECVQGLQLLITSRLKKKLNIEINPMIFKAISKKILISITWSVVYDHLYFVYFDEQQFCWCNITNRKLQFVINFKELKLNKLVIPEYLIINYPWWNELQAVQFKNNVYYLKYLERQEWLSIDDYNVWNSLLKWLHQICPRLSRLSSMNEKKIIYKDRKLHSVWNNNEI